MSRSTHYLKALAVAAVASVATLGATSSALGATASTTVSGGALQFATTPGDVTFPGVTLNGSDQTVTQTQPFDVSDATGSNAGWNITATSTQFTAGGTHTLPTTATTVTTTPSQVCEISSSCTLASNAITYPYTLPAGAVAPTATKLYNAGTNSGMGRQIITPNWRLTIPSTAWAGGLGSPYTATWTFTLVSGP